MIYRIGDTLRVEAVPVFDPEDAERRPEFTVTLLTLLTQNDADEVNRIGADRWIQTRISDSTVAILH